MVHRYLVLLLLPLVAILGFNACEGPEGPAGAQGEIGPAGEDGADGSLFCMTCHAPEAMDEIEAEFAQAGHSEPYTRFTSTSCAPCHSHEGYVEYGLNGQEDLEQPYTHGSKMTCGTCHSHSNNGEPAVFDTSAGSVPIRFNGPVVLRTGQADMDFGNNSNVCVRCHQPRRSWSTYDDEMGDMVMVTSSHAGPHHGNQGTTLLGQNGDHRLNEVTDASTLGPATHGIDSDCISCHMNEGSHTFKPVASSCEECHDVTPEFDYNGFRTNIATKMTTLEGYLLAVEGNAIERDTSDNWVVIPDSTVQGILHEEDGELHPVVGQFDRDVYSAFWNYMTVMEDQSGGVHNPAYSEALLDNSIAVFE